MNGSSEPTLRNSCNACLVSLPEDVTSAPAIPKRQRDANQLAGSRSTELRPAHLVRLADPPHGMPRQFTGSHRMCIICVYKAHPNALVHHACTDDPDMDSCGVFCDLQTPAEAPRLVASTVIFDQYICKLVEKCGSAILLRADSSLVAHQPPQPLLPLHSSASMQFVKITVIFALLAVASAFRGIQLFPPTSVPP